MTKRRRYRHRRRLPRSEAWSGCQCQTREARLHCCPARFGGPVACCAPAKCLVDHRRWLRCRCHRLRQHRRQRLPSRRCRLPPRHHRRPPRSHRRCQSQPRAARVRAPADRRNCRRRRLQTGRRCRLGRSKSRRSGRLWVAGAVGGRAASVGNLPRPPRRHPRWLPLLTRWGQSLLQRFRRPRRRPRHPGAARPTVPPEWGSRHSRQRLGRRSLACSGSRCRHAKRFVVTSGTLVAAKTCREWGPLREPSAAWAP